MNIKGFFNGDEMENEYEAPVTKTAVSADTRISLYEPRVFDEATGIAEKLKNGNVAAVNLHKLSKEYAQRTIDFLTGVVYALDGRIEKVGHNLILCMPNSVQLTGSIDMNAE